MEELLVMKEVLPKVKKAIDAVRTVTEAERAHRNREALSAVDAAAAGEFRRLIGDSVTADALDGFAADHAQTVKSETPIFPDAYRQDFLRRFLEQRPQALPYADQCGRAVQVYFDNLEQVLGDNLDAGDIILLRNIVSIHGKLDDIDATVHDTNTTVHDISEKQDAANGKLDILLDRVPPPEDPGLHTSNQLYADSYTETLFLHKGRNDRVTLQNLFVPHRFSTVSRYKDSEYFSAPTLDEYLARFINRQDSRQPPLLLIEGDAGCGKTSLSAYLVWHYENDPAFRRKMFGDRPLYAVRLRDMDILPDKKESEHLARSVLQYLRISVGELRRRNPVLLLDGYDELCTVAELGDPQAALYHLRDLKCQIILTCRPQYVNTTLFRYGRQYDYPYEHIQLEHFDGEQREDWLEHYTHNCGETVAKETLQYIRRIGGDSAESICDTPMGLYMVAARQFDADERDNPWALYHRIFGEEQRRTDYNPTITEDTFQTEHVAGEHWENIYRLSEEIAWYQYRRHNADLAVPGEAVREALERLGLENEDTKQLLSRCFALCGYWKTDPDRGGVEFYHNNIRDFFLCEKLMRELNEGYEKDLTEPEGDPLPFLKRLAGLLRYGPLEERVLDFLRQRAEYKAKTGCPDFCVQRERECRFLPRLFETLLLKGAPYTVDPNENPIQTVISILGNTFGIYARLYVSFLTEGEYIRWWTNVGEINHSGTFRMAAGRILNYAPCSVLRGADLRGADLRGADLRGADLIGANLSGADLIGANLSGADLSRSELLYANLSVADLSVADLSGAHLSGAYLRGAYLHGADLIGAHLRGADLSGAHLRGADLRSANLAGAHLSRANLHGSDLICADLTRADVTGADMYLCNLSGAKLDGCDLSKARNVPEEYLPQPPDGENT